MKRMIFGIATRIDLLEFITRSDVMQSSASANGTACSDNGSAFSDNGDASNGSG